jgi:pyruvate formate lyase activating enzyme
MIKEAMFYEKLDNNKVRCYLCAHQCQILPEKFGLCRVRQNQNGKLFSLVYGRAIASGVDPIEKKPLYHFLPGTLSYSIATAGCNFKCGFCQNWQISQKSAIDSQDQAKLLEPQEIVNQAKLYKCKSISYTYTEPTIFFEYAYDTAKLAKAQGLYNIFVTNGYMTKAPLDALRPYLDAVNVDLKSFREEFYLKNCQAHLKPVLDSIRYLKELGIWIEITTLIIPGQNDSQQELSELAGFIAGVGKDIPWHLSRFHPDYKFSDYESTSLASLNKAQNLGQEAGLRYIYLGNVLEDCPTYCYNCKQLIINRSYFRASDIKIKQGKCSFCNSKVEGVF